MIEFRDVRFRWRHDRPLILDVPQFDIKAGERVFLEGPSGSGKSTFLSILGAIVLPETGSVVVNGTDITKLSPTARDKFRADYVGVIFQMFNLIPYLSPEENTLLPCRFSKLRRNAARNKSGSAKKEALRLLMRMQLNDVKDLSAPAFQLSIGQQQRVAAARALIGLPKLIVADEPTSALDQDIQDIFIKLLFEEAASADATLLFVSHDQTLASQFDRSIKLTNINKVN